MQGTDGAELLLCALVRPPEREREKERDDEGTLPPLNSYATPVSLWQPVGDSAW